MATPKDSEPPESGAGKPGSSVPPAESEGSGKAQDSSASGPGTGFKLTFANPDEPEAALLEQRLELRPRGITASRAPLTLAPAHHAVPGSGSEPGEAERRRRLRRREAHRANRTVGEPVTPRSKWHFVALALIPVAAVGAFYAGKMVGLNLGRESSVPVMDRPATRRYEAAVAAMHAAMLAEKQGNLDEALRFYDRARKEDESLQGVACRMGTVFLALNRLDEADEYLVLSIEERQSVGASYDARARIAMRRNDLPTALAFHRKAVTADPFEGSHYENWANTLRLANKPAEAIPVSRQALALSRDKTSDERLALKLRFAEVAAARRSEFAAQLKAELEKPEPSSYWLLTAAAIECWAGNFGAAAHYLDRARQVTDPALFAEAMKDKLFADHAARPQIAKFFTR